MQIYKTVSYYVVQLYRAVFILLMRIFLLLKKLELLKYRSLCILKKFRMVVHAVHNQNIFRGPFSVLTMSHSVY